MNIEKVPKCLYALLNDKIGLLPNQDIENISRHIDHHEWVLAFENLCIQLCEYEIPINSAYYNILVNLGKLMNVDSFYWLDLKELIKDMPEGGIKKIS